MTEEGRVWPEVENLTVRWLRETMAATIFTETNTRLGDHLPAIVVARVGGMDAYGIDRFFDIELTAVAATRYGALTTAGAAYESMQRMARAATPGGWYIDAVEEIFGAAVIPADNPDHRAATATYRITVRPHQ